ncbi:ASCH domain-containing protein [archaeon]|jgi:hypothetical protein|nr:ASCH domain-containing protein [archaeon]MBT6182883.1 ASCH domain-containing protein [archaeon]MBT6606250.1 ASCH domain-containing protein [archaeon]MBT7251581.1 ASCH domain-containing protein [archaeon]MBT7660884.1 ASCH domain-containing protein [archaeon]
MTEKILHLTLHKEFFKQILNGTKKIEYREIKPYWTKRLFNADNKPIEYSKIIFKNGYAKDCPIMEVEFKGIRKKEDYEILLGKILKKKNIQNLK